MARCQTNRLGEHSLASYADAGSRRFLALFLVALLRVKTINLIDSERLSKLLALMALAMCWAIKVGTWLHSHTPLKIKKHGRKEKSFFRYGLDYLRSIVNDLALKQ